MFKNVSELMGSFSFLKEGAYLSSANWGCSEQADGHIVVHTSAHFPKSLEKDTFPWQKQHWLSKKEPLSQLQSSSAWVWIASGAFQKKWPPSYQAVEAAPGSLYGFYRDNVGQALIQALHQKVKVLNISFSSSSSNPEVYVGAFAGLEMAAYHFQKHKVDLPKLHVDGKKNLLSAFLNKGRSLGESVNLARHLVNLPAEHLAPVSYGKCLQKLFQGTLVSVNVWDEARLKKENMNLLLAVGQAGSQPPRLVKLSYPGKKGAAAAAAKKPPMVFVGKGVTYDTGGLSLKPAGAMRLMKKDMGGSAALAGLMWRLSEGSINYPVDVYLPLAENSVSANAFRPGDILKSKKGLSIEIDNTDAEGRLILADALTLAQEAPLKALVNVATLTGAIKAGLGSEVGGLFSNHSKISKGLFSASRRACDELWPMPLVQQMKRNLKSSVADLVNSNNAWGGAVNAALFLEAFIEEGTPWAHLDIFAWASSANRFYQHEGGNGQAVQALSFWLEEKPWLQNF